MYRHVIIAVVIALGVSGCRKSRASLATQSLGKMIAEGPATDLRLSNDGKFGFFIARGQRPRLEGVPPQMVVGELTAIQLIGGPAKRLGNGVTNAPGGYFVTSDSRWVLFLGGYNAASQSGDLNIFDLQNWESPPIPLSGGVTYVVSSADSKYLAFVTNGILKVGFLESRSFRELGGEVSNTAFTPDGKLVLFKRRLSAGGAFMVSNLPPKEPARKIAEQVGDYVISPDSTRVAFTRASAQSRGSYELHLVALAGRNSRSERIADGVGAIGFSPDGKWLVHKGNLRTEALGTGDLFVSSSQGGSTRKLAERVQDYEFSPDSSSIAYLEKYSDVYKGILGLTVLRDGKPRLIKNRVPNFTWGTSGRYLAFVTRVMQPLPSWDLMLLPIAEENASKVSPGVFMGYGFTPRDDRLLFRANCLPSGKACDLFSRDLRNSADTSKKIAEGIYSFKSSVNGEKLLLTYSSVDRELYDLAVYNFQTGTLRTIDRRIYLPATFASDDGGKVAYIVGDPSRAGAYIAESL